MIPGKVYETLKLEEKNHGKKSEFFLENAQILLKKKLFLLSFVSLFQYLYVCKFKIEFAKYCKTGNIKWIFYSWLCFLNYTISHKVSDIAKIHDIISLFKTVRKHLFHQIFGGDFGSFFLVRAIFWIGIRSTF